MPLPAFQRAQLALAIDECMPSGVRPVITGGMATTVRPVVSVLLHALTSAYLCRIGRRVGRRTSMYIRLVYIMAWSANAPIQSDHTLSLDRTAWTGSMFNPVLILAAPQNHFGVVLTSGPPLARVPSFPFAMLAQPQSPSSSAPGP